jgi:hypothetical protein
MSEPPIIWQHVVIACLSPVPAVAFGWALNRKMGQIKIKLNGEMSAMRKRLARLEKERAGKS